VPRMVELFGDRTQMTSEDYVAGNDGVVLEAHSPVLVRLLYANGGTNRDVGSKVSSGIEMIGGSGYLFVFTSPHNAFATLGS
jgi:hypothetical protein